MSTFDTVDEPVNVFGMAGYLIKPQDGINFIQAAICINRDNMPCGYEKATNVLCISNMHENTPGHRLFLRGCIHGFLTLQARINDLHANRSTIPIDQVMRD